MYLTNICWLLWARQWLDFKHILMKRKRQKFLPSEVSYFSRCVGRWSVSEIHWTLTVTSYRRKHKRERNQVRGWKSGYCVSILEQQAFVVSELVLVRKPVCLGPRDQRLPRCSQESSGTTGIASLAQAGFSSKLSHAVPGRTWLLWGSWRGAQSLWLVGSSPPPVPCHLGLSIRQRPAWQLLSINSSEGVSKTEDRVFLQPHLGRDSPSAWPRSIEWVISSSQPSRGGISQKPEGGGASQGASAKAACHRFTCLSRRARESFTEEVMFGQRTQGGEELSRQIPWSREGWVNGTARASSDVLGLFEKQQDQRGWRKVTKGRGVLGESSMCQDCFPRWRGFCKWDMSEIFFFEMLKKTRVGIDFNS